MRYDRQIRVWGDWGQQQLRDSHVAIVAGISAQNLVIETARSLILPGIGHISLYIPSIAGIATDLDFIKELNLETKLDVFEGDLDSALAVKAKFAMMIVIGWEYTLSQIAKAEQLTPKVPIIIGRSTGLFGYLRLLLPESLFIMTSACMDQANVMASAKSHLGLAIPDKQLIDFANRTMDCSIDEVPWVSLILHELQQATELDIDNLKKNLRARDKENSLMNVQEAIEGCTRTHLTGLGLASDGIEAVKIGQDLSAEQINDLMATANDNPIKERNLKIALALKGVSLFIDKYGRPPYQSTIPDMTASSSNFIQLKKIYKDLEERDISELIRLTQDWAVENKLSWTCLEHRFLHRFLYLLSRGVYKIEQGRSLADELREKNLPEDLTGLIGVCYVLMCAMESNNKEEFHQNKVDLTLLETAQTILSKKIELHCTAAFIGAMIAQETTKILTCHGRPLDNSLIWE